MRVIIQRVSRASVKVDDVVIAKIGTGLLVLCGIEASDDDDDINWLSKKVSNLRIFPDKDGVMNKSLIEVEGDAIIVSQFTLHASTKKGNRPSYIKAASPDIAIPIYEKFCDTFSAALGRQVGRGIFGADMKVELLNDGPVTICIDSKNKE
jgi:D-aminoacyl-tRNA deacylase